MDIPRWRTVFSQRSILAHDPVPAYRFAQADFRSAFLFISVSHMLGTCVARAFQQAPKGGSFTRRWKTICEAQKGAAEDYYETCFEVVRMWVGRFVHESLEYVHMDLFLVFPIFERSKGQSLWWKVVQFFFSFGTCVEKINHNFSWVVVIISNGNSLQNKICSLLH